MVNSLKQLVLVTRLAFNSIKLFGKGQVHFVPNKINQIFGRPRQFNALILSELASLVYYISIRLFHQHHRSVFESKHKLVDHVENELDMCLALVTLGQVGFSKSNVVLPFTSF
jgi:hypothetical protein